MQQSLTMCDTNAGADVVHQPHCTLRRHSSFASKQIAQRHAAHQFHHDVRLRRVTRAVVEVVNTDDVRMSDHRRRTRLSSKALERLLLANEIVMQQFDGHFVADVETLRTKNRAHAALAETLDQLVLGIEDETYAWIRRPRILFVSGSR